MAQAQYKITKPFLILGNATAAKLPAVAGSTFRMWKKNGLVDDIVLLPGTFLAFKNVDYLDMDTVDYDNMSVAEYLDEEVAFFLK